MTKRSVSRAVGAGALVAALALGGGAAAWANPLPDSGSTVGGTVVALPIPGSPGYTQIAHSVTAQFAVALDAGGSAYAWGRNNGGQLGNGTTTGSAVPVQVQAPAGVSLSGLSAGGIAYTLGIGSDGNAYAWGAQSTGLLGNGTGVGSTVPTPVSTPAGVTFTQVSAGLIHALALGSDGNAYAWGSNAWGMLGNGTNTSSSVPVQVQAPAGVTFTQVSASGTQSFALAANGDLYAWGSNGSGQFGNGDTTGSLVPVQAYASAGVTFTQVSAGGNYSMALGSDGRVYASGANNAGQLGDGTITDSQVPVQVQLPAGLTFTQVTSGNTSSFAVASDGNAYAWGSNADGVLGDGTSAPQYLPVRVGGPVAVTAVTFDGVPGTGLVDNGDGTISVTAPAHAAGAVDVAVEWTLGGVAQTPVAYAGGYTYAAPLAAPTVTGPVAQSIAAGGSATFSVTAAGNPAPTLAWEVSTDGGAAWQPIAADSAATVAVDGLSVAIANAPAGHDGYRYRAVASNSEGSATSAAAVLTVVSTTGGGGSSSGAGNGRADGGSGVLATTGGEPLLVWAAVGGIALLAGAGILTARAPRRRAL
jgi:alpha-tubulin suppressor-like RCC1 family protein